jgi:hypothetical protein
MPRRRATMRAFQVSLNGKKLCTAGVGEDGVLTTIVTWVGPTRNRARKGQRTSKSEDLDLSVGGLISPNREHVSWHECSLRVGDEVQIQIVDRASVDRPSQRRKVDPSQDIREKKAYVRRIAKELGWTITRSGIP